MREDVLNNSHLSRGKCGCCLIDAIFQRGIDWRIDESGLVIRAFLEQPDTLEVIECVLNGVGRRVQRGC